MPTTKRKPRKERRQCLHCGKTYVVKKHWQRYCQPICSQLAYRERIRERLRVAERFLREQARAATS